MYKCQHEVPCTCDEYLNRLTEKELLNLRIQFGRVPTINDKFNSFRCNKRKATREVKEVNQVLAKKFRYVIV